MKSAVNFVVTDDTAFICVPVPDVVQNFMELRIYKKYGQTSDNFHLNWSDYLCVNIYSVEKYGIENCTETSFLNLSSIFKYKKLFLKSFCYVIETL